MALESADPALRPPGLLAGKAVVVAGAARGMGRAVAEAAAAAGASLVLADVRAADVEALAQELDVDERPCAALAFDTGDPGDCARLADRCVELYGRIDGAVTTAAVMQTKPFFEISRDDFERMTRVNLAGTFYFLQAAAARMDGGGSIVLFSSTAARGPRPLALHYAATKAGVSSIVRSAAVALAPAGVRVNAICPGLVATPMMAEIWRTRAELDGTTPEEIAEGMRRSVPLGRLGAPADVAGVVAFLLSDAAAYVTGEALGVTGGTDGTL